MSPETASTAAAVSEPGPDVPRAVVAFEDLAEPDEAYERPERRDHVAAVLVCSDGARWLPAVLTSLARSERTPHVVVAVDAGSSDATARLLHRAVEQGVVDEVVDVPRGTSYGAAVAAGAARATPGSGAWSPEQQWLWLLHDDSAPAPGALEELLHASDGAPSVAIAGPKVRGWHDHRLLLECGVTMTRGGTRVTGLERGEQDQGQRDGLRDVLAVGSAGMLVRRDVWDRLAGFDPGLAFFRDDVDLCWRARRAGYRVVVTGDAVIHHRQAGTHGARDVGGRARRRDRASAIHVLLAHAGRLALPFVALRLLLGSLLRALGYLIGKAPREARDELAALADVLLRPMAVARSRALARAAGSGPGAVRERDVRAYLAPRGSQLRAAWERLVGVVLSGGDAGESAPDELGDGDGWIVPTRTTKWRSALLRPGVLLTVLLLAATAVAVRSLVGAGQLTGGALLPAPPGARDLLGAYLTPWHDIGLGSDAAAPVWLALLALPAAVLRGQAPLAVDLVLLLAVPAAGLSAYLSTAGILSSRWLRCWAAAAYALLPALVVAVGTGRIGSALVAVLLPPLGRSAARLLGADPPGARPAARGGGRRRAWGTALLLAVVTAFAPVVWVLALVLAVPAAVVVRHSWPRLLIALASVPVLLAPWTVRVVREPALLLLEPGLTGPTDRRVDGLDLLLLHPGGPGSTPLWFTVPVVVAALAAVLRRSRWRGVLSAWAVALVALGIGVLQLALLLEVTGLARPVRPWAGPATLVAGAALLLAAALGADGLRASSARWSFGWRQPAVAVLTLSLLLVPVAAGATWTAGVRGPLTRADPQVVPAFVAADLDTPARPRVLVLRVPGGHVRYDLLNSAGPVLGDRDQATLPPAQVDAAVGALVAGVGGDEMDTLAAWSVKYVLLRGPAARDRALVRVLDSQAALRRVSGSRHTALWRVAGPAPRAQLVPAVAQGAAPRPALPLDPGTQVPLQLRATPGAGDVPGRLLLAQEAAPGWTARAGGPDGPVLASTTTGSPVPGRFAAEVPASVRTFALGYEDAGRTRLLWAQLVALLLVVVLALPGRRHTPEDADADLLDAAVGGAVGGAGDGPEAPAREREASAGPVVVP